MQASGAASTCSCAPKPSHVIPRRWPQSDSSGLQACPRCVCSSSLIPSSLASLGEIKEQQRRCLGRWQAGEYEKSMTSTNRVKAPKIETQARELGQLPIKSGCLPTGQTGLPMCWDSGAAFLPLIARLGPSSTTSRVKTLGPCGVCARGLQRGEKAKPGKAQRVYRLLHMMHAPKRRAGAAAAPSRSKREGRPRPPQTGRFDQPCGKTVPSGNLGPMQREREALLHYLLETTAK